MTRAGRSLGALEGRHTRPPAVAGRFYPGDRDALARAVDRLLGAVTLDEPDAEPDALAYVVPHAGYQYSGFTAAHVYARLRRRAGSVTRVVLVGPAHYVPLLGCAVPAARQWSTPLGDLPVDVAGVRALAAGGHAAVDDEPHAPEHSIEVQLPFLQRALPDAVAVLPIAVGRAPAEDVMGTLTAALAVRPAGTVVICSTDLSHYLEDAAARRRDAETARAVLDLAPDRIGTRDACGVYGLRGVLTWARHRELRAALLHLCTSADATGDRSEVVGYAAFAFQGEAGQR
jgi:AmmeMemoRadiSam system protein B